MAVPVSTFNIYLFIIKCDLIRSIKGTQNKNKKHENHPTKNKTTIITIIIK